MCIELGLSSRTSSSSPTSSSGYFKNFRMVPVPVPQKNGTLGPVLVRFLEIKKIQISIPELRPGSGFG